MGGGGIEASAVTLSYGGGSSESKTRNYPKASEGNYDFVPPRNPLLRHATRSTSPAPARSLNPPPPPRSSVDYFPPPPGASSRRTRAAPRRHPRRHSDSARTRSAPPRRPPGPVQLLPGCPDISNGHYSMLRDCK